MICIEERFNGWLIVVGEWFIIWLTMADGCHFGDSAGTSKSKVFAILLEHCLLGHGHSGGHLRALERAANIGGCEVLQSALEHRAGVVAEVISKKG